MKTIFSLLFSFMIISGAFAQDNSAEEAVIRASMNYLEGFYEGDTLKLKESLSPQLLKFGYWKDRETGQYGDKDFMTFEQAVQYAKRVFDSGNHPPESAPKEAVVLDMMDKIAVTKVTAWWGYDYLLLSKEDGKWIIHQVIWQGPLQRKG